MPGEKTEKGTSKRRREERKQGHVLKSTELITVFSMLVGFYSLKLMGPSIMNVLSETITRYISLAGVQRSISQSDIRIIFIDGCTIFARTALPLLLLAGFTVVVVTMVQTKMLFTTDVLKFKFSHLNPISGIKRLFSLRSLVTLAQASVKIAVLLYIVYRKFIDYMPRFRTLMDMEPIEALSVLGEFLMSLVLLCGVIFMFLAAGDYVYQWWSYEKSIRMSKDEIKEEYKNTEGDPKIKGKIKERQRRMAMSRMMQSVPQADVIIRNPTHFAVAIKYDPDNNRAPVVLAKGADLVARRIIELAEEHDIMTVENKPLARGLYDAVDVGYEIPEEFYQPVAEVLAFVYSLTNKKL